MVFKMCCQETSKNQGTQSQDREARLDGASLRNAAGAVGTELLRWLHRQDREAWMGSLFCSSVALGN